MSLLLLDSITRVCPPLVPMDMVLGFLLLIFWTTTVTCDPLWSFPFTGVYPVIHP